MDAPDTLTALPDPRPFLPSYPCATSTAWKPEEAEAIVAGMRFYGEQVRASLAAAAHEPNAALMELADRIDHEQLWRRSPLERDSMTQEQRDRIDAGVALRRYADLLGDGGWRIYPPRPGMCFRAGTLATVVDMARRSEQLRAGAMPRQLFDRFGILLDDIANFLTEQAAEARERGQDSAAAGRDAQAFALRELLHLLIAGHHVPSANGQALFWYRPCSDGTFDGPLPEGVIEDVRKRSGAWVPLYAGQAPGAAKPKPWPELLPLFNDYATAMIDAALHQSASKQDIAKSQAVKALQRLREAIYGDAKSYGEVRR